MNSTHEQFNKHVDNELKDVKLEHLKYLILARYARQLKIFKATGRAILDARQDLVITDPELKATWKSVDDCLLGLTKAAKTEAELLFAKVLEKNKISIGLGLKFDHAPGESENMISACDYMLNQCYEYIIKHDRGAERKYQDLFPNTIQKKIAPMIALNSVISYLCQNWFSVGMHEAYAKISVFSRPVKDQFYNPEKSSEKRNALIELLKEIEEISSRLKEDKNELWSEAMRKVDVMGKRVSLFTTNKPATVCYLFDLQQDRQPKMYQELHAQLLEQAAHETENVAQLHQRCNFLPT